MQADALHHGQGANALHLRAVEAGGSEGFVVGDLRDDAVFVKEVLVVFESFEKLGQGRAGVPGNDADLAF